MKDRLNEWWRERERKREREMERKRHKRKAKSDQMLTSFWNDDPYKACKVNCTHFTKLQRTTNKLGCLVHFKPTFIRMDIFQKENSKYYTVDSLHVECIDRCRAIVKMLSCHIVVCKKNCTVSHNVGIFLNNWQFNGVYSEKSYDILWCINSFMY